MRIVFLGTPQFAVPSLEKLIDHPEFEVVAVVTQPDKRRSRGKKVLPSPVKSVAVDAEIPVWQPKRIKKDLDTLEKLRQAQADAFVVVAYGQILSSEILAMPRLGCVNGHGSLLPQYRGAAPIQWCLYRGETQTGMTTMLMDEGMDTGAMLLKSYLDIGLLDNAWQVAEGLAAQCADLLVETLTKLDRSDIEPTPQNPEDATYAPLIQKDDYSLDWNRSAIALHNQIRGFYPNCVTSFREQSLKVKATAPLGDAYWQQLPAEIAALGDRWAEISDKAGKPGEILEIVKNIGPIVETGQGKLLLQEVQLAGKKTQSAWDFANGTRLEVGECLG